MISPLTYFVVCVGWWWKLETNSDPLLKSIDKEIMLGWEQCAVEAVLLSGQGLVTVWCGCDLHPPTSSHPASLPGTVASTQPRLASWHGGWGHQGLTLNSGLPRHFKSCYRCTCDELFTVDCAAAAGSSLQPEAAGLPSLGPARPPASNVQQQLGFYTKAFCTFYWLDTWIYLSIVFIFAYHCLFYGRCFGSGASQFH